MSQEKKAERRGLVNRRAVSHSLDLAIADQLDHLTSVTKIPKSRLLDEAVYDLYVKYKKNGRIPAE